MSSFRISDLWNHIKCEALLFSKREPLLLKFYDNCILKYKNLSHSLSYILSRKLSTHHVSFSAIQKVFNDIYLHSPFILNAVVNDIQAILNRDPSVNNYLTPFLYLKGFHALEAYRLSNYLWHKKNYPLAIFLQSRISRVFSVDIHPAAYIGSGVMLDHATGIVIGEGAIIEDNVSIFHSVTLGSTGKNHSKNRHPKIGNGVVIGAGAKVLGDIEIGSKTKIGAGSIVLKTMPSYVTVVGVPAKVIKNFNSKNVFS